MAIRFVCKCGQPLVMLDEYAGRRVRCRQCGHEQTVPSSGSAAPDIQTIDFTTGPTRESAASERVRLPGLRTDSNDEDEAPEFPLDPWYYYFFWILGVLAIILGGVGVMIGLLSDQGKEVGTLGAFLVLGYSFMSIITGAGILLFVDIARNIRRLRLHADWNAGIRE